MRSHQENRHARCVRSTEQPGHLAVYDGNHDGNVGNQCQRKAATGSQLLQRGRADLAIRYT
jgi:hypothetical protein